MLENYYLPGELERQVAAFVDHYAEFDYCNTNYVFLGLVAEEIEGQPSVAVLPPTPSTTAVSTRQAAGGLVTYGLRVSNNFSGAAAYVHRLLKGSNPMRWGSKMLRTSKVNKSCNLGTCERF